MGRNHFHVIIIQAGSLPGEELVVSPSGAMLEQPWTSIVTACEDVLQLQSERTAVKDGPYRPVEAAACVRRLPPAHALLPCVKLVEMM